MRARVLQHIKPISKKDQVVERIKRAILLGDLKAGEAIIENKMAQDLGIGNPLVREALIELEQQGFVQRIPYKGTTVTKLSAQDIEHIFSLRVELESLAIEWAKPHTTATDVDELRELVQGMRQAAEEMREDLFTDHDLAFHRKLWQLSGNPHLAKSLEKIVVPLFAFSLMRNHPDRETYLESATIHEQIVAALVLLEASELRKKVIKFMLRWKDDLLTRLIPNQA